MRDCGPVGLARVRLSAASLMDYSERVTRVMLRAIPDGALNAIAERHIGQVYARLETLRRRGH